MRVFYLTYEKTLLSQTNFAATLPEPIPVQARLAVKDAYTFEFLELGDEYSERQLEAAILAQVEPFLREMGGRFSLVGSTTAERKEPQRLRRQNRHRRF